MSLSEDLAKHRTIPAYRLAQCESVSASTIIDKELNASPEQQQT
jgi:hypothetical protein